MISAILASLGPVGTVLGWFLGPIGKYVGLALVALALYAAWDINIRHDERNKINHAQKVEREHAVKKGTAARERALRRYDAGRLRDDGFARD